MKYLNRVVTVMELFELKCQRESDFIINFCFYYKMNQVVEIAIILSIGLFIVGIGVLIYYNVIHRNINAKLQKCKDRGRSKLNKCHNSVKICDKKFQDLKSNCSNDLDLGVQ